MIALPPIWYNFIQKTGKKKKKKAVDSLPKYLKHSHKTIITPETVTSEVNPSEWALFKITLYLYDLFL